MTVRDVVLVGGAGSVGRVLVEKLTDHRVWIVDRAIDSARVPSLGDAQLVPCELNDPTQLDKLSRTLPSALTVVFLASSLANPTDPSAIAGLLCDNVVSVGRFLATLGERIEHFLFVSSISVYGIPSRNPISESDPIAPVTPYGASKAAAEMVAQALCAPRKIPLTIVRAAQLFGLRSAQGTLPHLLVERLSRREDVNMSGPPGTFRDYLHVSDACDLLAAMLTEPRPSIYNAGSGAGVSLLQLFQAAFSAFGVPFVADPNSASPPPLSSPSFSQLLEIDKARREFGFSPRRTVKAWFCEQAAASCGGPR